MIEWNCKNRLVSLITIHRNTHQKEKKKKKNRQSVKSPRKKYQDVREKRKVVSWLISLYFFSCRELQKLLPQLLFFSFFPQFSLLCFTFPFLPPEFSKGLWQNFVMGCCESTFLTETHPEKVQTQQPAPPYAAVEPPPPPLPPAVGPDPTPPEEMVSTFSEFSFSDLKAATDNFNSNFIVSESGEKAPNIVYKGRLQNRKWIAVKKFTKVAWPDAKQFVVLSLWRILLCFGVFVEFFLILRNGCVWNFGGIFFLGRGFGSWEATASKVCEFDRVLLRWWWEAACCGVHA